MLATDEDAVICDFAETYHVLDLDALDVRLAATLAAGLPPTSRIRRKLGGSEYSADTILLASAVDNLALIRWLNTTDGEKGINRPESVLAKLLGEKTESDVMTFADAQSFEAYRAKLLEGVTDG